MLRAPEPRPGELGAASCSPPAVPPSQSKPLTSFLIQDILRDGPERRGGHGDSSQPRRLPQLPRRSAPKRDPEPEPGGGGGGAGSPEDEPSARPQTAPGEAETPAETEPGKPARLGRPGWAGRGSAGRRASLRAARTGGRAGPGRTSRSSGCRDAGPRGDRRRDLTASCRGRALGIKPAPQRQGGPGVSRRLRGLSAPGLQSGRACGARGPPASRGAPDAGSVPPRCLHGARPAYLSAVTVTNMSQIADNNLLVLIN